MHEHQPNSFRVTIECLADGFPLALPSTKYSFIRPTTNSSPLIDACPFRVVTTRHQTFVSRSFDDKIAALSSVEPLVKHNCYHFNQTNFNLLISTREISLGEADVTDGCTIFLLKDIRSIPSCKFEDQSVCRQSRLQLRRVMIKLSDSRPPIPHTTCCFPPIDIPYLNWLHTPNTVHIQRQKTSYVSEVTVSGSNVAKQVNSDIERKRARWTLTVSSLENWYMLPRNLNLEIQ